jgi:ankyrin repeat protein
MLQTRYVAFYIFRYSSRHLSQPLLFQFRLFMQNGITPLLAAVCANSVETVQLLLENGADINHVDVAVSALDEYWSAVLFFNALF